MRAHHHQHRSRSASTRPFLAAVLAVLLAGAGGGCISPLGFKSSSVYSREEFVALVKKYPWNWDNMFYRGTDSKYHQFITRIGGNSAYFCVPVADLKLSSTKPVNEHLIEVHPEDGFRFGPGTKTWY
ncbi:hypothetical protein DES53_12322 [Roseimicrobium gellanilyticum]|uniref:Uncharacterized protein n=1 Tax=Roseimicrobium gellanilyticum TaxID=748857 RepID=A0A366H0G5_9BACT|nr:hypothetical protein [Roseimicrobium gellanilyticum]RBP35326.1 hypothetical protein DES53_12322 [Roseimicrobium gellanilyticum]